LFAKKTFLNLNLNLNLNFFFLK